MHDLADARLEVDKNSGNAIEGSARRAPGIPHVVSGHRAKLNRRVHHRSGERPTVIEYKGRRIRTPLKVDILVSGQVVVEVKAVERLHPVHQAQVITYLKLTGCPAGLLLNFNAATLKAGLKRLDHPERYTKPLTNQGITGEQILCRPTSLGRRYKNGPSQYAPRTRASRHKRRRER